MLTTFVPAAGDDGMTPRLSQHHPDRRTMSTPRCHLGRLRPYLASNSLPQGISSNLCLLCHYKLDAFRQIVRIEFLGGDGFRPGSSAMDHRSPKGLVTKEWNDDSRSAQSEADSSSACSSMMTDRCDFSEKPIMWDVS